jgi:hypothetical protein
MRAFPVPSLSVEWDVELFNVREHVMQYDDGRTLFIGIPFSHPWMALPPVLLNSSEYYD